MKTGEFYRVTGRLLGFETDRMSKIKMTSLASTRHLDQIADPVFLRLWKEDLRTEQLRYYNNDDMRGVKCRYEKLESYQQATDKFRILHGAD